jgi:hypothetical protein
VTNTKNPEAAAVGIVDIGGDLTVNRLGYGAMRLTGKGIWGPPSDHDEAVAVLHRAVELGITFIDTADSYGPYVAEHLIREALHPYPDDPGFPWPQDHWPPPTDHCTSWPSTTTPHPHSSRWHGCSSGPP